MKEFAQPKFWRTWAWLLLLALLTTLVSACDATNEGAAQVNSAINTISITTTAVPSKFTPPPTAAFTPDPGLTHIAQVIATQTARPTQPTLNAANVSVDNQAGLASPTFAPLATPVQASPLPVLTPASLSTSNNGLTASLVNQFGLGNAEPLLSLALSPNGKLLALGGRHQIWLWEAATGKVVQTVYASASFSDERGAASLSWSLNGKQLAAGGLHGVVMIWQLDQTGTRLRNGPLRLEPEQDAATWGAEVEVAFSPDGSSLATVDSKGTIVVWDSQTFALKILWDTGYAGHITWSADSKSVADEFFEVGYLNDLNLFVAGEEVNAGSSEPYNVAWSPNNKYVATSSRDYDLLLAFAPDPSTRNSILKLAGSVATSSASSPEKLRPMDWSKDSQWLAIGNVNSLGKISIYQANTQKQILTWEVGNQPLTALQWSANSLLITGGMDGTIKFWRLK